MKMERIRVLGVVALMGAVAITGCKQKSETEPAGMAERTGAALDTAAEKTAEAGATVVEKTVEGAKTTATATKEVTGKVVEKTGEVIEKAGTAVEGAGAGMREGAEAPTTDE